MITMQRSTVFVAQLIKPEELRENDVLFGRGTGPNENQGNIRFRELVKGETRRQQTVVLKTEIARNVVCAIKSKNGRFLKQLTKAERKELARELGLKPSQYQYLYTTVPDTVIMEKVRQAIRFQMKMSEQLQGAPSSDKNNECDHLADDWLGMKATGKAPETELSIGPSTLPEMPSLARKRLSRTVEQPNDRSISKQIVMERARQAMQHQSSASAQQISSPLVVVAANEAAPRTRLETEHALEEERPTGVDNSFQPGKRIKRFSSVNHVEHNGNHLLYGRSLDPCETDESALGLSIYPQEESEQHKSNCAQSQIDYVYRSTLQNASSLVADQTADRISSMVFNGFGVNLNPLTATDSSKTLGDLDVLLGSESYGRQSNVSKGPKEGCERPDLTALNSIFFACRSCLVLIQGCSISVLTPLLLTTNHTFLLKRAMRMQTLQADETTIEKGCTHNIDIVR